MSETLASRMALKQATSAAAVGLTREYTVSPGDAVELTMVVLGLSGTAPFLNAVIELSNDGVSWTDDSAVAGPASLGYFAIPVSSVAARRLRIRIELTSSEANGIAVFSVTAERVRL